MTLHIGAGSSSSVSPMPTGMAFARVLGVVEVGEGCDLRRDRSVAGGPKLLAVHVARAFRRLALRLGRVQHRRAVLRADVVALPHALGRIVALPEQLQEVLVARLGRVEHDQHRLGVAGASAADLPVGRVGRMPARVADRGREHARRLPEHALCAPEATEAEHRPLEPLGKRRLEGSAEHIVARRHGHPLLTARKSVFR
jgi:hypothetical protein